MGTKRIGGAALIETALVIIPYLALTFGGIEYMWYVHVRQSLTAAADAAVEVVAVDHNEVAEPGNSLAPYLPGAETAAINVLTNLGFSDSFIATVAIDIDYINQLNDPRLNISGGIPQSLGLRLVGAMLSVPWEETMLFGDFAAQVLGIVTTPPTELVVTSLMWKRWKAASQ